MKPLRKVDLNTLRKQWYKTLKEDGFVDIEHEDGSINNAVPRTIRKGDMAAHQRLDTTRAYYQMCEVFLREFKFESELDKVMWEYFSNGLSYREIARTITESGAKKVSKDIVWRIVTKLEKIMKDKYLSV